jgi:hypothetical protein
MLRRLELELAVREVAAVAELALAQRNPWLAQLRLAHMLDSETRS